MFALQLSNHSGGESCAACYTSPAMASPSRSMTAEGKSEEIHHAGPYSEVSCAEINIDVLGFTHPQSRWNIYCDAHSIAINNHFTEWPAQRDTWRQKKSRNHPNIRTQLAVTIDALVKLCRWIIYWWWWLWLKLCSCLPPFPINPPPPPPRCLERTSGIYGQDDDSAAALAALHQDLLYFHNWKSVIMFS